MTNVVTEKMTRSFVKRRLFAANLRRFSAARLS